MLPTLRYLTLIALLAMANFDSVLAMPETEVVINDTGGGGGGNRTLMVVVFTEETGGGGSNNSSSSSNSNSNSTTEEMSEAAPPPPFCRNLSHPHPDKEYLQVSEGGKSIS